SAEPRTVIDNPTPNRSWTRARALLVPATWAGVYVLLTAAAFWAGQLYLSALLPILRSEISWLLPTGFALQSLDLVTRDGQRLIELQVMTTIRLAFTHGVLRPQMGFWSSALQAHALHHPIIIMSVLAAWPTGASWRGRLVMLALGIPCV